MIIPKVTVIVPIYNVEKYLSKCLNSIITQSLKDIEIVCIDDGSNDGSGKIVDRFAKNDNRIIVIHKANEGYGKAVNIGIRLARGEYLGIVESDDYIDSRMYETLYNIAQENKIDIIKADFFRIFKEGVPERDYITRNSCSNLYGRVINTENELDAIMKAYMFTWSGIYRTKFLKNEKLFHNETPGASFQDNGFWFLTMGSAKKIYFLKRPFYYLRRNNPESSVFSKGKVNEICREYEFIYKWMIADQNKYKKLSKYYWAALISNYIWTYKRIDKRYRKEFLIKFYLKLKEIKIIPFELLASDKIKIINSILIYPNHKYLDKILYKTKLSLKDRITVYYRRYGFRKFLIRVFHELLAIFR